MVDLLIYFHNQIKTKLNFMKRLESHIV